MRTKVIRCFLKSVFPIPKTRNATQGQKRCANSRREYLLFSDFGSSRQFLLQQISLFLTHGQSRGQMRKTELELCSAGARDEPF